MIVCLLHENMMNIGKLDKRSSWDVKKILATCQDDVWTVGLRNLKAKTDLCYVKPYYFLLTKVFFSDGGLHKPELKILKRGQFCFVAMFRIWNARIINKVVGNLLGKLSRRLQSWQCWAHTVVLIIIFWTNSQSSFEQKIILWTDSLTILSSGGAPRLAKMWWEFQISTQSGWTQIWPILWGSWPSLHTSLIVHYDT